MRVAALRQTGTQPSEEPSEIPGDEISLNRVVSTNNSVPQYLTQQLVAAQPKCAKRRAPGLLASVLQAARPGSTPSVLPDASSRRRREHNWAA